MAMIMGPRRLLRPAVLTLAHLSRHSMQCSRVTFSTVSPAPVDASVTTAQSSPYAQTHTSAHVINFGIGQPSPSLLPLALFRKAAQHRFRDRQDNLLFQYGAGLGYEGFRSDLAAYLSGEQSSPVDPDELLITAGNSQAISHAAMTFSKLNKRVFVEEPTYFLAFDLFRELGLELATVSVDAHGLDVDALEKRLEGGDVPAFIYTIPFFHNPTGTVLPPDRREKLVALAHKFAFRIISDEPYNLLNLDAQTPSYAPLASHDTSGRVVSLGSFSKILAPGLRLGWAQSSRDTIQALSSIGTIRSGGGQNPLTAAIVHSVLQLDLLAPHIAHLRSVFMSRKATLCSALHELCPDCTFVEPAGGYFVWLQLPRGVDAEQLLVEASANHGVAFTPGARCSLPPRAPSTTSGATSDSGDEADERKRGGDDADANAAMMSRSIRLSFAFYSENEIRLGVQRLERALRVIQSSTPPQ